MNEQPRFSESEWALVLELLRRELSDLPAEIHHTQTSSYREDLIARRRMVQDLIHRLEPAGAFASS